MLSVLIATIGAYLYVFWQWQQGTGGYWIFNVGFIMMDVFLLIAMVAVYRGVPEKFADAESVPQVKRNNRNRKPSVTSDVGKTVP
jgi:uncharacterized membrane protein